LRGEVENFSIWQGRLKANHEFVDLYFTETPSKGRIQDSGFSPFREFSFGFQERMMKNGHVVLMVMIRVAQHHHGGTFLVLFWDPKITFLDSSYVITGFEFLEFTFGRLRGGCLEEWSFEELTDFL
jgi:hypothetical protein